MSEGHHAQTDLFHLYPTDGKVNGMRSSYPYGLVDDDKATFTSTDGAKLGPCNEEKTGYADTCFEPTDQFKGDLSRSYFYISTTYADVFTCCDEAGVDGSHIKPWLEAVLRKWHVEDPVDMKETDRNELIFSKYQKNRNPFIDHPEYVDRITDF
jgi:endonuclease I